MKSKKCIQPEWVTCGPPITEGPVAQRIRHLTTNQGIPGSNPGGVEVLYFCPVLLRNSKKGYKWWSYWQHEPSPTLLITVSLLFGQRFWWTHFYRLCGEGDIKRSEAFPFSFKRLSIRPENSLHKIFFLWGLVVVVSTKLVYRHHQN